MMRATSTNETSLVVAAQAGDRRALDELVATGLPLVYSIVRRALSGHLDADDVVQDTLLRAVRQLPALHNPQSFRPWLASIAVHQVSTHLHRRIAAAQRAATLDEAAEVPDAEAEFEDLTMLRLELSGQRRQVARASRWLDPDDRALLSLWWLETAGELTRAELAAALGVGIAHAGVRVQRMRHQLDVSRGLVAALDARPQCGTLEAVLADWDGTPNPLWRKRIARHTRACAVCAPTADGMIAADRLLGGLALLPVPGGLAAALLGKIALTGTTTAATSTAALAGAGASGGVGASVKAGLFSQLIQTVVAHPVAAMITAGALAAGAAVTATTLPAPVPPGSGVYAAPLSAPAVRPTPSSAPAVTRPAPKPPTSPAASPSVSRAEPLSPGRPVSLESADQPGRFVTTVVTTADSLGFLTPVGSSSTAATRRQATFAVIAGLADADCFSFRQDGRYLRHAYWRLRLNQNAGTQLFRGDATFCVRPGATAGSVALESANYPGWFLHHRGDQLWVDHSDGSAAFRAESSFRTRPALAG
jgi:RNA polymerase sigma factor (sigma-70 family)